MFSVNYKIYGGEIMNTDKKAKRKRRIFYHIYAPLSIWWSYKHRKWLKDDNPRFDTECIKGCTTFTTAYTMKRSLKLAVSLYNLTNEQVEVERITRKKGQFQITMLYYGL